MYKVGHFAYSIKELPKNRRGVFMKTVTFGKHRNCIELESGIFRILVTTEVGPRVIGGFIDGSDNIFVTLPNRAMPKIGTGFKLYGGHRLWHSPEAAPRSYAPDNDPVEVIELGGGAIAFSNPPEELTGIQKSIIIEPIDDNGFKLTHRLVNCGVWPVTLAPWGLSMMAPGGTAIIPQYREPDGYPYAPDRTLVMWAYSSFTDPRLCIGDDYILLKQDPSATTACKIGFNADEGWIGYANKGVALIKYFDVFDGYEFQYPDRGCNVESYTCAEFCEIETVAPLYELAPDEDCEHVEYWQGLSGLPEISTVEDVAEHIEPLLI